MSDTTTLDRAPATATAANASWAAFLPRAFRAQILGTWRPRGTMCKTENIPLRAAWVSHFVTAMLGLLPMALTAMNVIYFLNWYRRPDSTPGYLAAIREMTGELVSAMGSFRFWLVLTIALAFLQAANLLLALLCTSWAAGHEPTGRAFRHSLRTVWLLTPLFLFFLFGHWLCVMFTDAPLVRAVTYSHNLRAWMDFIFYWALILLSAWTVWVLLRACAARPERSKPETRWCETCGYNLSGTDAGSRCSECGEPASDSLGAGLRRPTPWECNSGGFVVVAYWRTFREVIFHPVRFCRHLHAYSGQAEARNFLIISVLLTGLLSSSPWLLVLAKRHWLDLSNLTFLSYLPAVHFGILLGIVLLVSGGTGTAVSWIYGRPLLAPIAKVFFYFSGWYVLLMPGWWLAVVLLEIGWNDLLGAPQVLHLPRWIRINLGAFTGLALLPPLLFYLVVVHARGIRRILHANT